MLALAVCAFTAAGHDSPTAIAEWAGPGCPREALLILGGRPDPLTGRVRPPSTRTFRRVFAKINADALNQALYGFLEAMPPAGPEEELPEVTRHEREQRRAAAAARQPAVPCLLPHAAADGKTTRGAVRPDGSQVHLLSAFHVTESRTMAQREVDAKTNEIPGLIPMLEGLDLDGMVITADALHGQRETARKIREDLGAHYLLFIKANQPSLLDAITARLNGTDEQFAGTTWTGQGKGHGRRREARHPHRPRRRHRPAIRRPGPAHPRDAGPTLGPWKARRSPTASPASPPASPDPATSPSTHASTGQSKTRSITSATSHSGRTHRKHAPAASPTPTPAFRNLVMGAFRRKGHANIAAARRYYGRDDQRILALYGYL